MLGFSGAGWAGGPNPLPAVRGDKWAEAQAAAAANSEPLATKLVRFYRLLAPNGGGFAEISAFMRENPDWPGASQLARRRDEALISAPNAADCTSPRPTLDRALAACAGVVADGEAYAREAWVSGLADPAAEVAFRARWGGILSDSDEWARYLRLSSSNQSAAERQLTRLSAADRVRAESVPARIVARAKALRLARDWDAAKDVWRGQTGADQTAAMWSERNALVRELLSQRDDRTAYEIAKTHGQTDTESLTDAEFLCGFIALRRLNTPDIALGHFRTLAKASPAAITQGRAHYWIGRALAASGRDPKVSYGEAAKWPTTFYGQLASLASNLDIKSRILAATDPVVASNYNHELIRAAKLLLEWGDPGRARVFLVRLDEIAPNAAIRSTVARRAVEIGAPDSAVYIARRMGRDGIALPVAGWPAPYAPPEVVEPAYALGIMRQESSFDVAAVSRSGALGLMQLMPATARTVAKGLKVPLSIPALTADPDANMRLGTAYLRELLDRFYGSYILAAAGYNAGPNRVDQWMALNGDPTASFDAMLDWIELIPFAETRNYVQRVAENVTIYRARAGDGRPVLDPR